VPLATVLCSVLVVTATYLVLQLAIRLREVLMILVVAGFIALLLNPVVVSLQKRGIHHRGYAVAVVVAASTVAFLGLTVVFGYPLVNGVSHLAHRLPSSVSDAEHGTGWIGRVVTRLHLENWVQRNAPKVASIAEKLGRPALAVGRGAASLVIELVTIFTLALLLLLEGPKIRVWLLATISPERAARYSHIGALVSRSVTGYVLGDLITSLAAGAVVFVTLTVLGVPFALLWALWVALVDFIPLVGGALAGIPTVLFALGHSLTAGVVTAAVFLVYTQVENHVLDPIVMSRTVRVNPLLVLLSILVGAQIGYLVGGVFGGLVAALISIPIAGSLQVIASEMWRASAPGPLVTTGGDDEVSTETS
jgi:predicted PurR-regulated permease PerM